MNVYEVGFYSLGFFLEVVEGRIRLQVFFEVVYRQCLRMLLEMEKERFFFDRKGRVKEVVMKLMNMIVLVIFVYCYLIGF